MLVMSIVQAVLMIGIPLVVAILAVRRKCTWQLVLVGAATFVGSQVVHLPMNAGIGLVLQQLPAPPHWAQVPLQALIAGFTAGLCEEWARFLILRMTLKRRPEWAHGRGALAHGIGHGGIESAILGGLVVLTLINMVFIRDFQGEVLPGVTPDQMETVRAQVAEFWATPPAMTMIGVAERCMTMVLHVAFSVLVFRGVVEGKTSWVWISMAWHWLLDTSVVLAIGWLGREHGIWVSEGIVFVHMLVAVVVIRRTIRTLP